MSRDREAIGHTGDEIADRPESLNLVLLTPPPFRKQQGIIAIGFEKAANHALRLGPNRYQLRRIVKMFVEEMLERTFFSSEIFGKTG